MVNFNSCFDITRGYPKNQWYFPCTSKPRYGQVACPHGKDAKDAKEIAGFAGFGAAVLAANPSTTSMYPPVISQLSYRTWFISRWFHLLKNAHFKFPKGDLYVYRYVWLWFAIFSSLCLGNFKKEYKCDEFFFQIEANRHGDCIRWCSALGFLTILSFQLL